MKYFMLTLSLLCLLSLPAVADEKAPAPADTKSSAPADTKPSSKPAPDIDPAFCRKMVTYQEPDGVEYKSGVDANGKPVVEPDLNPSPVKMPDTVSFGLTVDTAQYLGLTTPAGLEGKMMIGTVEMKDGHVTFNGQPLEGQAEAALRSLCAQEKEPASTTGHKGVDGVNDGKIDIMTGKPPVHMPPIPAPPSGIAP